MTKAKYTSTGEDKAYLTEQIITYIGNKRSLLNNIENVIKDIQNESGKIRLDIVDLFSGSGIVSRLFKQYSNNLYTNDLEGYSYTINSCYLMNRSSIDELKLQKYYSFLSDNLVEEKLRSGFITKMYSPKNDNAIEVGERAFYKRRNAMYIDTERMLIEDMEEPYKTLFLGQLLYEASVKTNTAGVFKGFYKCSKTGIGKFGGNGENALTRILNNIQVRIPVLSNYECNYKIFKEDANNLVNMLPDVDVAYLDPPYNQHPYGSNYFMLNLINEYKMPEKVSKVSGIPIGWNHSAYNNKTSSMEALEDLCSKLKTKYIIISFNSEGFIAENDLRKLLEKYGKVRVYDYHYNVFRGSRNLNNRNIHLKEYIFVLRKE